VAAKVTGMAAGTPARPPAYWQKVEKQETPEIQVIRGLFEEGKVNDTNS